MTDARARDPWGETTRWTLILNGEDRNEAWHFLLKRYRGPVIAWVRSRLRGHPEAEDVALDFFQYLWENQALARADRSRGKFRAFLQGYLKNYLKQARRTTLRHPGAEPSDLVGEELTPEVEAEEEAAWARRILHNACKELLENYTRNGAMLMEFYGLKPFEKLTIPQLSQRYGLEENAVYQALHQARRRLHERLRSEVLQTVADSTSREEEWALVTKRLRELQGGRLRDLFDDPEGTRSTPAETL